MQRCAARPGGRQPAWPRLPGAVFNKDANRTDCQLIVGYRGLIDSAAAAAKSRASKRAASSQNDEFTLRYGLNPQLEYMSRLMMTPRAGLSGDIAHIRGSKPQVEVMTLPYIERIRKASKSGSLPVGRALTRWRARPWSAAVQVPLLRD